MSHTPTPGPWKIESNRIWGTPCKRMGEVQDMVRIAEMSPNHMVDNETNIANAAHIVRCVNTHDQLVAALKDMHEVLSDLLEDPHAQMTTQRYAALQAIDKSKQALAAAEKGA